MCGCTYWPTDKLYGCMYRPAGLGLGSPPPQTPTPFSSFPRLPMQPKHQRHGPYVPPHGLHHNHGHNFPVEPQSPPPLPRNDSKYFMYFLLLFLLQGTTRAVVARLLSQLLDEIFTFHFPFFSCSKKNNITAVTAIYNPWICWSSRWAFSLSQDSTVIYYWTFEPFHNGKLPEPNSRTLPTKWTLVISTSTDGRIKVGQLCSDVFSRCDKLRETRWCLIIIK